MAGATLATEAVLLTRKDSGEHGLLLTFLSAEHGLLRAFKRTSSRGRQPHPDLFDKATLRMEKPAGGGDFWFVSEYMVQKRRPGIGAHYEALVYASRYAILLAQHLFEVEEAQLWTEHLEQALDAWETGQRPESTYFKSLYLFARAQGIPVREEWMASLNPKQAGEARAILRQPVAGQTTPAAAVEELIADFERYLRHGHDVRLDPGH